MRGPFIGLLACAAIAAPPGAPRATPQIYRCKLDGVTVYEDRPCGADAAPYAPDGERVSTYAPPPARPETARPAPRRQQPRAARGSIAEAQQQRAEECRRIAAALREIQSQMRAGYDARKGERLRLRKAKLDEQRRAHKCG